MDNINEIPVLPTLSDNMVSFAKKYVKLRIVDGLAIGDWGNMQRIGYFNENLLQVGKDRCL